MNRILLSAMLFWVATTPRLAASTNAVDAFKDKTVDGKSEQAAGPTKWDAMDVGPFFSSGFAGKHPACKAISIKLGVGEQAVTFDTELLRMTMGWTGGFLKLPHLRGGLEGFPEPIGTEVFSTPALPGWARQGSFIDPRPKFRRYDYGMNDKKLVPFPMEITYGHLPVEWAHYKGLYLNGDSVILSYTVGKKEVLETPGFSEVNKLPVFSRTFDISGPSSSMELLICEVRDVSQIKLGENYIAAIQDTTNGTKRLAGVGLINAPGDAAFDIKEGCIVLKLPRTSKPLNFKVLITSGEATVLDQFASVVKNTSDVRPLKPLCRGGAARWGEPLVTKGVVGRNDAAYTVDTLTVPEVNPWKSWIRPGGFDFFSDGRAALCSVSGDVWIVDGIDDKLEKLAWKRFATGLFQPLGLKIVRDRIYITGRDQITRLHDLNNDGEADFYENFNNDISITPHYHEFSLGLETDSKGNFYFAKGSNLRDAAIPHHGTLIKVSPDGKKLESVCNGLRAPNGLAIGPNDEITIADNEGRWMPSSQISLVKKGGFYGNVLTGFTERPRTNYDNPLLWIPHKNNIDNSSGGQVWVTSDKWGPLKGKMLHTSYGTCSLFEVMTENVEGTWQGGIVRLPLKFDSGIMRGRFNPRDGQLYLCGLSVWQSNAIKEGGFQRVRYTGKPVYLPTELHVKNSAIEITFTCPLDPELATDPENYSVEQWNYRWSNDYGSKEYSLLNPKEAKHDAVEVKSVTLSADKKTVTLQLAEVRPVMQMKIQYNIDAADGTTLKQEIFNSIFKVPSAGAEGIVSRKVQ